MTSSIWTKLPLFGKLGLNLDPKAPSSHSTKRTTTIVVSMGFSPLFLIQPLSQLAERLAN